MHKDPRYNLEIEQEGKARPGQGTGRRSVGILMLKACKAKAESVFIIKLIKVYPRKEDERVKGGVSGAGRLREGGRQCRHQAESCFL